MSEHSDNGSNRTLGHEKQAYEGKSYWQLFLEGIGGQLPGSATDYAATRPDRNGAPASTGRNIAGSGVRTTLGGLDFLSVFLGNSLMQILMKIFFVFLLLSLPAYAEDERQEAIPYEEWQALSLQEIKTRLASGEFDPNQVVVRWDVYTRPYLSVLSRAAGVKSVDYVRTLLEYGADLHKGETALDDIVVKNRRDMVKFLAESGVDMNQQYFSKPPILLVRLMKVVENASNEDIKQMIDLLLENGADINGTDPYAGNIVNSLVHYCESDLIEYVATLGANVNYTDRFDTSPLMLAAWRNPDAISLLITKGANVNQKEPDGMSVAHYSVIRGHKPAFVMRQLLAAGANIGGRYERRTLLEYASLRAKGSRSLYDLYLNGPASKTACSDSEAERSFEEWRREGQEVYELLTKYIERLETPVS